MHRTFHNEVRLARPNSGAYQEAILRTQVATWKAEAGALPVEIELMSVARRGLCHSAGDAAGRVRARAHPLRLTVHPGGGYEYVSPGPVRVARPGGFGADAVLDWMKACGIDTSQPAVREEAARIAGEARLVPRRGRRALGGSGHSRYGSSTSGSDSGGQFNAYYSQGERRPPPALLAAGTPRPPLVRRVGPRRATPGGRQRRLPHAARRSGSAAGKKPR